MSFPLCGIDLGPDWIDDGTSTRMRCFPPGPLGTSGPADAGAAFDTGGDVPGKTVPRAPNPPPITAPSKTTVKQETTAEAEFDVSVEVVADGSDPKLPAGTAETSFDNGVVVVTPQIAWEEQHGKKIVTKLNTPLSVKGVITVHTRYGTGASANQPSGYGRGTTDEDIKARNTSLGFHESCHRVDMLGYLASIPLPAFDGKVGMETKTFTQAGSDFRARMNSYFTAMQRQSELSTDEVGYTKAKYEAFGPKPTP